MKEYEFVVPWQMNQRREDELYVHHRTEEVKMEAAMETEEVEQ